jgi:membrane-associated protein
MHLFDPVQLITHGGFVVIALIIFFESGFPFGFVFPGDTLLFAAGFLAAEGQIPLISIILIVALASAAGGIVGYYTGRKLGDRFVSKPSRFVKQSYIDKTVAFFARFGSKAVMVARFVPIIRTFLPILAGVGSMRARSFHLYNILGAFLWPLLIVHVGYFFGHRIPNLERVLAPVMLTVVALSLCIPLITLFRTRKKIM